MSVLFDFSQKCPSCRAGHLPTPCRPPCVCRCRCCDARMRCNVTSRQISDQHDWKPLAKFGSASIRRPISEGIAKASQDDRLSKAAAQEIE